MTSHLWYLIWVEDVGTRLGALQKHDRDKVMAKIAALAISENPYSVPGVEKLSEKRFEGQRRIRQGNIRIVFQLHPGEFVRDKFEYKGKLEILAIDDRRDVYKKK